MTRSSLRPAFCKEKCNELFTSSTQATFCYKDIKVLRKKKSRQSYFMMVPYLEKQLNSFCREAKLKY